MNLHELHIRFKNERECHDYLIQLRWSSGAECPYCKSKEVYRRNWHPGFKCRSCNCSFSVRNGTIFQSTKLPLLKWFQAISIISSAKKGISSLQLARTIGVHKNTAWYIQKRLRSVMQNEILSMSGLIEIDETYIGGSLSNMAQHEKKKRNPYRSGMIHKVPVLGIIERYNKKVILDVIQHAKGDLIKPILKKKINAKSKIVTDGHGSYYGLNKLFKKHVKINAEKKQRSWGRYNINTIEGFFSIIKRAIIGQYHQLSAIHLQSYMDEISFKKNHVENVFEALLNKSCAV
jgi:transposase-like protein